MTTTTATLAALLPTDATQPLTVAPPTDPSTVATSPESGQVAPEPANRAIAKAAGRIAEYLAKGDRAQCHFRYLAAAVALDCVQQQVAKGRERSYVVKELEECLVQITGAKAKGQDLVQFAAAIQCIAGLLEQEPAKLARALTIGVAKALQPLVERGKGEEWTLKAHTRDLVQSLMAQIMGPGTWTAEYVAKQVHAIQQHHYTQQAAAIAAAAAKVTDEEQQEKLLEQAATLEERAAKSAAKAAGETESKGTSPRGKVTVPDFQPVLADAAGDVPDGALTQWEEQLFAISTADKAPAGCSAEWFDSPEAGLLCGTKRAEYAAALLCNGVDAVTALVPELLDGCHEETLQALVTALLGHERFATALEAAIGPVTVTA